MALAKLYKLLNTEFEDNIPDWIFECLSNIPKNWEFILFGKKQRNILVKILDKLDSLEDTNEILSPRPVNIFQFSRLSSLNRIKVVIIGQDPYPNRNHAHGLAFSSLDSTIPASLKNIYKCLIKCELLKKMPKSSDLSIWSKRGVLLLNNALTTVAGSSNAHKEDWTEYSNLIVKKISENALKKDRTLIFMLWGKEAQKKAEFIDESHIILKSRHPSPMAQNCDDKYKFVNCTNFTKANKILKELCEENKNSERGPIDWSLKKKVIEVYTDGSAYPNKNIPKAKNGYACVFTKGCLENLVICGSSPEFVMHPTKNKKMCSTSQRAEGMAILKAAIKCNSVPMDQWDELEVVTDSDFWCNMLTSYMPRWEKNGMDFDDKENPDITKKLWNEWKKLNKKGSAIIRHINSHGKGGLKDAESGTKSWYDYKNNETVDELANMSRLQLEYDEYMESDDLLE